MHRKFNPNAIRAIAHPLLLLLLVLGAQAHAQSRSDDDLRVMSFNVRYANPEDGINAWENRRELMLRTIERRQPDIIGTQELLLRQAKDLKAGLRDYAWFGKGRNGNEIDDKDNEHMGVFYDTRRLELLEHGDFWYSNTPDVPGSSNFGTPMPRMATWGRFRDLRSGQRFYLFNTHFPHRPEAGALRVRCARLLLERIGKLPADEPVIVTGDFNAAPDSAAHRLLTASLHDAWEAAPRRFGPGPSAHGFTGKPTERIDWVLFRHMDVARVETVTDHEGQIFPSDHFAVVADLTLPAQPR